MIITLTLDIQFVSMSVEPRECDSEHNDACMNVKQMINNTIHSSRLNPYTPARGEGALVFCDGLTGRGGCQIMVWGDSNTDTSQTGTAIYIISPVFCLCKCWVSKYPMVAPL